MAERTFLESSPSESRGLLMDLARRQAAARAPKDVLGQWRRDATVRPSAMDLRTAVELDALALDAAPRYEGLLLSPVAPLGTSSVVAPTSQDRTLTTIRTSEVVSDPTNVLAIECARRIAADPTTAVRVCTSQQTLRMQGVRADAGRSQHFRLFALADAGRGRPDAGFEVDAVVRQVGVHDRIFDRFEARGHPMPDRSFVLRVAHDREALGDRVAEALTARWPRSAIRRTPLTSDYYGGLRLGYGATDAEGGFQEVVDLRMFDWVAQYTSNASNRFVASAVGIQLLPLLF